MPNFNEIYPSKSLKAEDLNRRPRVFTISDVEVKDYKDGAKLVLSFEETEKTFTLNKTNAMTIGGLYGENYVKWIDCKVILRPDVTNYPTPNSPCIRVAPELPDDAPAQRRQPVGAAVGGDEDIPF
jgi:hypothetical protein